MNTLATAPSIQDRDACFSTGETGACLGISFHLPSRQRFIPYSWLEHVEMDRDGKELRFSFAHSLVIVSGTGLDELRQAAEGFTLCAVMEKASLDSGPNAGTSVARIEIHELAP